MKLLVKWEIKKNIWYLFFITLRLRIGWKTISFLTRNYDIIVIPNFRILEMVKIKKLPIITKRMLYMFYFYSFFLLLKFKCKITKTTLKMVGKEYTSKTCSGCGELNNIGSLEVYHCNNCHLTIDRDINTRHCSR